jgi:hypothetical protein
MSICMYNIDNNICMYNIDDNECNTLAANTATTTHLRCGTDMPTCTLIDCNLASQLSKAAHMDAFLCHSEHNNNY